MLRQLLVSTSKVNTPSFPLVNLPSAQALGHLPSTTPWSLITGPKQDHHPSPRPSIRSLSNNYHRPIHLTPICLSFPISPPPSSPLQRQIDWGLPWYWWGVVGGGRRWLKSYWSKGVVVEMWCHTMFFLTDLSPLCLWYAASVTYDNRFFHPLLSSPLAKTRNQALVSVEPDAPETRSWYLLQLSRTQCSGEADQRPTHKTCTHHGLIRNN